MLYTEITIGEEDYKLRLTTRGIVQLERKLGKNPLQVLMEVSETQLPKIEDIVSVFFISLRPFHPKLKEDQAYELFDKYVEEGNSIMDFVPVLVEIYKTGGLIGDDEEVEEAEKND